MEFASKAKLLPRQRSGKEGFERIRAGSQHNFLWAENLFEAVRNFKQTGRNR